MGWTGRPDDPGLEQVLLCERCGRPLGDDPDDDPAGDPLGPLCGECARVRDFEADVMYLDASDGSLDGEVEW
jgi:hypothetical protein